MATKADLAWLNVGKKPINKTPERAAAYRAVNADFEAVYGTVEPIETPIGRIPQRASKLYSSAAWNWEETKDRNDRSPIENPAGNSYVIVSGGAGVSASKQAGVAAATAEKLNIAKVVVSSGGAIAWIPALLGMSTQDIARMNAGVPSADLMASIPDTRLRDSLSGKNHMSRLGTWFDSWMQYAGTPTFGDVKFPTGHPLPVPGLLRGVDGELKTRPADPYRISIGVSVWTPEMVFRERFSREQLDDPRMVQRLLTEIYKAETPIHNVRQRFFPNDIQEELSWMRT